MKKSFNPLLLDLGRFQLPTSKTELFLKNEFTSITARAVFKHIVENPQDMLRGGYGKLCEVFKLSMSEVFAQLKKINDQMFIKYGIYLTFVVGRKDTLKPGPGFEKYLVKPITDEKEIERHQNMALEYLGFLNA